MLFFKNLSIKNKRLMLIIEMELLILLFIVLCFCRDVLNLGNVVEYASSSDVPVVTAADGYLEFDTVRVKVPHQGANYVIGYDWARGDKDYPTVPSSASAYYTDDSDEITYEVLLYRDKVTPKPEGDDGSALDTWFDEWEHKTDGNIEQHTYTTPNTEGFIIRTTAEPSEDDQDNADKDNNKTYCSYTYYFAVETENDIEQYVLEINYYDPAAIEKAEDIFANCAGSISVRVPA